MSHTTITHLVLSLTAVSLSALITACGAETDPSDPATQSDKVAEAAQNYAGEVDPAQRKYLARYYSDRAMSDAWQRHPELVGR